MPLLYLFVERYGRSEVKEHVAVENSVASPLRNGLVEGTNSKIKMVKRNMYGRCGIKLLAVKLMFQFE